MKIRYSTKMGLCIQEIKPDELASVMALASDDGYGPNIGSVHPEYKVDCEGCPIYKKGTYTVTFETPWIEGDRGEFPEMHLRMFEEIEDSLTE